MKRSRVLSAIASGLVAILLGTFVGIRTSAQEKENSAGRKVAFLVGINKYMTPGLPNLKYAEPDVDAIAALLRTFGFDVTVLKGSSKGSAQATRENIETTVRRLAVPLCRDDMMLVMLSGHSSRRAPDGGLRGRGTSRERQNASTQESVLPLPGTLSNAIYLRCLWLAEPVDSNRRGGPIGPSGPGQETDR